MSFKPGSLTFSCNHMLNHSFEGVQVGFLKYDIRLLFVVFSFIWFSLCLNLCILLIIF